MSLILLYVCQPEASERTPVRRSLKGHVRAIGMRTFDRLRWKLLKDFRIDYDAWRVVTNTNKGDAAIRQAIAAQLAALPLPTPLEFVEVGWGELSEHHVARLNATRGLFVIAGSGYLFFGPDNQLPPRIAHDIALIGQMSCPRIAYGIGVNQIRTDGTLRPLDRAAIAPGSLDQLRQLAGLMDAVSVRDENTREIVAALTDRPVRLTGDPALFLAPRPPARSTLSAEPMLVGLNFILHSSIVAASLPDRMRWLLPVVRRMQEAWRCRLRYFVHSDTERVFPLLLRQHGIEVEVVDAPVQAMLDAYAELDLHLCQMMHSSILSLAAGIPTVTVGYDAKNLEFFCLMGLADLCFEPGGLDPEQLFVRIGRLHEERDALAATIGEAKRRLGAELARFHGDVVALMASAPAGLRHLPPAAASPRPAPADRAV